MKCKITKVEIIPLKIELKETFTISIGPLTHASITVVKIYVDGDMWGTGECCPYRTIHTESQLDSVTCGQHLAKAIIGCDARHVIKINKIMQKVIPQHASIKAAFDMALYDLNAKMVQQPLYQYLHGDKEKKIFTDMTISLMDRQLMIEKAIENMEAGFPMQKIKLGDKNIENDIDRVRSIREVVGSGYPLCLDANQGWETSDAIHGLRSMEYLDISHCEAPIYSGQHDDLIKIRSQVSIPIMGDESIFSPQDTYHMIHRGCVDMINIKLGKSGGIHQSMKVAAVAESAGISCQVGCFSETRLGITALVHFSMAWDHIVHHDLDSPLMHSEDPIIGGLIYEKDWSVSITDASGIGADYDSDFLNHWDKVVIN